MVSPSPRSCAACASVTRLPGERSSLNSSSEAPIAIELAAAADLASAWLFAYVDVLSSVAEDTYTRERERWLRTAAALQTETVDAILTGRDVDGPSASVRLRYELERDHVALVGWYEGAEEGRDTIADLEAVIRELAGRLSADRPLIEPLGLLAVAAWVG